MHHFNVDSLRDCYQELDGRKALGTDGMSKERYGLNLEDNLVALVECLKTMSYRPSPVRQVLIPKEGKTGLRKFWKASMSRNFWTVPLGSGQIKAVTMRFRHWVDICY